MTDKPVGQQLGPWRLQIAPGWNRPEIAEALTQLRFLLERAQAPLLAPPGRNQVHRLQLPCGDSSTEVVVKTYGVQSPWRDRRAQLIGSKAERAFATPSAQRRRRHPPIGWPNTGKAVHFRRLHPSAPNLRGDSAATYCAAQVTLVTVANQTPPARYRPALHGDLRQQNIALQFL